MTSENHIPLQREPGSLEDSKYREDYWYDSATGYLSGPEMSTEFITPSFGPGEVWELRVDYSLSSEATNGEVIVRIMDEDESNVIVRHVLDTYDKNTHSLHAVVTAEEAAWDSGAGSPDIQIEAVGSDSFNYLLTCHGVRLRRPSNTNRKLDDGETESFDRSY